MYDMPQYAELLFGDRKVTFYGTAGQSGVNDDIHISSDGIEGWYSMPDLKVTQTERATGNGAHDIVAGDVLYAARTVTLHFVIRSSGSDSLHSLINETLACAGNLVKLRVVDAGHDTYVDGYAKVAYDANVGGLSRAGTLTVVCPRPERLSWDQRMSFLSPSSLGEGGLVFDSTHGFIDLPINFGVAANDNGTTRIIENNGTFMACPIITVSGNFPYGVTFTHVGGQLSYDQPIGYVPLTFDSRTHTATMQGIDQSRFLSHRNFPVIEPGESLKLSLDAAGTGTVSVSVRDTYI